MLNVKYFKFRETNFIRFISHTIIHIVLNNNINLTYIYLNTIAEK